MDHERVLEAEVSRNEDRLDELVSSIASTLLIPLSTSTTNPANPTASTSGTSAGAGMHVVTSMSNSAPTPSGAGTGTGAGMESYDDTIAAIRGIPLQPHHPSGSTSTYGAGPGLHASTPTSQQQQNPYAWHPQRPVSAVSTSTLDLDAGYGPEGTGAGAGELEEWGEGMNDVRFRFVFRRRRLLLALRFCSIVSSSAFLSAFFINTSPTSSYSFTVSSAFSSALFFQPRSSLSPSPLFKLKNRLTKKLTLQ